MQDTLFDARKLVGEIGPAGWGQTFATVDKWGEHVCGKALSLDRIVDCLEDAMVEPHPNEGYIKRNPRALLQRLVLLMGKPRFGSGAELRNFFGNIHYYKLSNLCHGERHVIAAINDAPDDETRYLLYLPFADMVDRVLPQLTADQEKKSGDQDGHGD